MNLNKNFLKYFLLIQLYFSIFINLFALNNHISFEHISIEQGLSNGTIYSIIQDEKGFLWFGTPDGLNKFDGYDFTVFKHDLVDPFSISNNNAGNIFIDSSGFIWIGTWGGGKMYDPC